MPTQNKTTIKATQAPERPVLEVGKTRVRIFQEPTGRWHISNDDLPYLEARGTGYPTRAAAVKDAKSWGWIICH
jgi:hypothetical protein